MSTADRYSNADSDIYLGRFSSCAQIRATSIGSGYRNPSSERKSARLHYHTKYTLALYPVQSRMFCERDKVCRTLYDQNI
ncbi:hypothetical protein BDY21DRAFT_341983 [Lineolata rhizophorae]|uniref:Uncharacterized protein n=1 Tax=Lineolata rhizophorae TaxID=578093 RepID=A0A6A6P2Z1_9PEZI|nr:hypothetical protein BDY21DRAFT_341983 [Lineolata rhizophorae]